MKKKFISALLSATMILACAPCLTACSSSKADYVIYGNIYTANDAYEYAEAVAIKDGKFIFVGSKKDAAKYVGNSTVVETYSEDKLITPALVDGHTHVTQLVVKMADTLGQISYGASKATCIKEIKAYIDSNPDLDFYTLTGWEMQNFSKEKYGCPTAAMIDGLTTKPVLALSSDGHSYWVNTALMKLAGVTKDTVAPDGGVIIKDKKGNPLGVFNDTAEYIIDNVRPGTSAEAYYAGIAQSNQMCLEQGYVYRFDALSNMAFNSWKYPLINYMEEMDQRGELQAYTQGSFIINNVDDAYELVDVAINLKEKTAGGNFELTNVKIFLDGIIENSGAYLSEPYEFDSSYYGSQRWVGEDALIKMGHIIAEANKAGMSVHFHGMGDQAISDILTAMEYAVNEVGIDVVRNARNAIAHLALVKESDYERFVNLNVIAVFNPWCNKDPGYYDLQVSLLGQERADSQYPMESMVEAGVKYAFGTDLGASFTYNSIECFHALTTRLYNNDDPNSLLNADEKLSRTETLKAMTIGGAYELKKENTFGSIEVGKDASLCLFSQDLLTIPEDQIMSTVVENTMYLGNWIK